jgi:hypothetical protein
MAANGNYSYDLGAWHIVSLNSNCSDTGCQDSVAGTSSSAEVSWLQGDLAAHPNQCTLAYWHHPRFTSGFVGNSPGVGPLWNALYAAHADVVLGGHDHMYERFAQQDPSQHATGEGMREFVVGSGGESLFAVTTVQPNLEAVDNNHFGVLFLTLHRSSYDWSFRSTEGGVLDSGTAACHAQAAAGSAAIRALSTTAGPQPAVAQLSAVTAARKLAPASSSGLQALVFDAHPAARSPATAQALPLDVHCSQACDLTITLGVRRGSRLLPVARFRETETQIPRANSRVVLHLSRRLGNELLHVPLTATLQAMDATGERHTLTRVFAPAQTRGRG